VKTLTLVRHAKSDWDKPELSDHDRTLNARGLNAAPAVGKELARRGCNPDLLLCSTALRAATTASLLAAELGIDDADILRCDALYLAPVSDYQRAVAAIDDSAEITHAMLVAHNPGIHDFAHHLTGGYEIDRFVTCAVATIELDVEHWGEIDAGRGRLVNFFTPHDL
jgi:phosphohistidine phosphatase